MHSMASALVKPKMTPAQFLLWELEQAERYDFVDGQAYCMAGGTLEHSEGALSVALALKNHLKGSPCRVFMSDVQVRVEQLGNYFYPDISVTCSPADLADPQATYIAQPSLIIEVLSPSTAAYDRGDKFASLRQLASLKEYALLDLGAQRLEVFRRNAQDRWELFETRGSAGTAQLESVQWSGTLAQLLA
jgi:Uma2 family endonuclease